MQTQSESMHSQQQLHLLSWDHNEQLRQSQAATPLPKKRTKILKITTESLTTTSGQIDVGALPKRPSNLPSPSSQNASQKISVSHSNNGNAGGSNNAEKVNGVLTIRIVSGNLLRNTELFGKMDPFILINYKDQKYQTEAINEGGKNPVWNRTFEIPIENFHDDEIKMTCFDEDVLKDDNVGEAKFKIFQIAKIEGESKKAKLILMYKGEKAAEITVQTQFASTNIALPIPKIAHGGAGLPTQGQKLLNPNTLQGARSSVDGMSNGSHQSSGNSYNSSIYQAPTSYGSNGSVMRENSQKHLLPALQNLTSSQKPVRPSLSYKNVLNSNQRLILGEQGSPKPIQGILKPTSPQAYQIQRSEYSYGQSSLQDQEKRDSNMSLTQHLLDRPATASPGLLVVKAVMAKLTHDTELRGKMDPYLKFTFRDQHFQTRSLPEAGLNPVWNQEFSFRVFSMGEQIKIEVFDKDIFSSDKVGDTTLNIGDLCVSYGVHKWIPIFYDEGRKIAGEVYLETAYQPPVENWIEDENFGKQNSIQNMSTNHSTIKHSMEHIDVTQSTPNLKFGHGGMIGRQQALTHLFIQDTPVQKSYQSESYFSKTSQKTSPQHYQISSSLQSQQLFNQTQGSILKPPPRASVAAETITKRPSGLQLDSLGMRESVLENNAKPRVTFSSSALHQEGKLSSTNVGGGFCSSPQPVAGVGLSQEFGGNQSRNQAGIAARGSLLQSVGLSSLFNTQAVPTSMSPGAGALRESKIKKSSEFNQTIWNRVPEKF
ncbi:hypothetical protein FGO68_gene5962 [Halteria grandinella]|uniref:C2 domain-containing protein n=1 Tax=Halteria grandinella TaxID=5974 RepID=A0A8J8T5H6_HALGN|nr:hypothetical protein FGO68_gene5962 [Halteria grandinella]